MQKQRFYTKMYNMSKIWEIRQKYGNINSWVGRNDFYALLKISFEVLEKYPIKQVCMHSSMLVTV